MRISFAIALIITLLSSGSYFYYVAGSNCPVPLSYELKELDERFGLTREEALEAIAKAESVWEEATQKNLFTQKTGASELAINFTFDDRQALVKKEESFKEKLDETQNVSDEMRDTYTRLVAEYNTKLVTFNESSERYEVRLFDYNAEVTKYNERGGAPSDVFARLEDERRQLSLIENRLNTQTAELRVMVSEINSLGEKANRVITTYNESVDVYNDTFGGEREFIQGDYTDGVIHIYTFDSKAELVLVLVHELGHALSLEHVENSDSAMHYLLKGGGGEKSLALEDVQLTGDDLSEFERVCGEKSVGERLELGLKKWYALFI